MSEVAKQDWPFGTLKMFGYDVGMIDPAWPWEAYSEKGEEKSPEAQYETMSIEEICALPVGNLLRPGGVLWIWCTWPTLALGYPMRAMAAWGLKGITGGAWAKRTRTGKLRWGTGYVLRSVCEPFIIAATGDDHGFGSKRHHNLIETIEEGLLDGLAREHSRKPDEAYKLIEAVTPPALFKCDVFARQRRIGWDGFGKELDKFPPA